MSHLRRGAAGVCLAVAALASAGCLARRTPAIRYYTLSVPRPATPTIDATMTISTVAAEPGYTETRLAWRPSPYRVDYTSFHRWIAAPATMIASVLEEHFARASTGNPARRVYVTGTVRRIEAVDDETGRAAVLSLSLAADLEGRPLLERTWDEREPVADGEDAEAVAAALSIALTRVLDDFTAALARALPVD